MLYPVNLELEKFDIVIIGGGKVAYRKCQNFIRFNKAVKVVAPQFIQEFYGLKNIELIQDVYREKYIEDCHIVVAATNNSKINQEIGEYCHRHKKLVNVVDNLLLSNYTVPSFVKRGDLLLSVSTGGKSPALSRKIKQDLEGKYDETYAEYVDLLGEMRQMVISNYQDSDMRKRLIRQLITLDLEELKQAYKTWTEEK
ncbi:MAG: bifunctional precorrin-2 dehydrogenase/sirohydrochlorin ferrochelatase [Turicibacter sp.]|nr:bifunctional precorrin-2 dehydrogenase/sirohydrochlorin ferrochelatase [Turicibacter sp.]